MFTWLALWDKSPGCVQMPGFVPIHHKPTCANLALCLLNEIEKKLLCHHTSQTNLNYSNMPKLNLRLNIFKHFFFFYRKTNLHGNISCMLSNYNVIIMWFIKCSGWYWPKSKEPTPESLAVSQITYYTRCTYCILFTKLSSKEAHFHQWIINKKGNYNSDFFLENCVI